VQNLAEVENAIAKVERCLKLSSECGFEGLAAAIREDIRKEIIPATLALAAAADAPGRTTIILRYRKLAKMLAQQNAQATQRSNSASSSITSGLSVSSALPSGKSPTVSQGGAAGLISRTRR
jgi:hypothetical protein